MEQYYDDDHPGLENFRGILLQLVDFSTIPRKVRKLYVSVFDKDIDDLELYQELKALYDN